MVLLDHFANKSNTSPSLAPSLALPFPPISSLGLHFLRSWIPIDGTLGGIFQDLNAALDVSQKFPRAIECNLLTV